ncbi:MAG: hypothetical protein IID45_08335, partial [Planctomycetes bacterium]|nr:hypothetical protein [Planctomycetota bacterium]
MHDLQQINSRGTMRIGVRLFLSAFLLLVSATDGISAEKKPAPSTGGISAGRGETFSEIFFPAEALDVVWSHGAKRVLMPRAKFERLLQQAQQAEEKMRGLPRGIVVSGVKYRATLTGSQVVLAAEVTFHQFRPGWQTLPLPFSTMNVEQALLGNQPALIGRDARNGNALMLLNGRRGEWKLSLALSTPLHEVGSDMLATLELVRSPAATLEITLPSGKHLLIDGRAVKRPAAITEPAKYEISVGNRHRVRLRISDGIQSRPKDSLLLATTRMTVHSDAAEVRWQAETSIETVGTGRSQFEFSVSDPLKVTAVEAAGLPSWPCRAVQDG